MKYHILIILLLISILPACTQKSNIQVVDIISDAKLYGKWQSDKEKTIQWMRENRKFSEERIEKIATVTKLGTLTLDIKENLSTYTYDGETKELPPYNVIAKTCNAIAVIELNPLTSQEEIRIMRIEDENTYSIYVDYFDIREFFTRIK